MKNTVQNLFPKKNCKGFKKINNSDVIYDIHKNENFLQ